MMKKLDYPIVDKIKAFIINKPVYQEDNRLGGINSKQKQITKTSSTPIPENKIETKSEHPLLTFSPSSKDEEAMPLCIPHNERGQVGKIIMDYWDFDCPELEEIKHDKPITINPRLSFFGQTSHPILMLAGQCILHRQVKELMILLNTNPNLFETVVEVKDPRGRRVKGTLLQIAAAGGSFNPFVMDAKKEPYGIVEQLSCRLPKEIVKAQLEAQFPPDWKERTAKRMKRYVDAAKAFGDNVLVTDAASVHAYSSFETFKTACKPFIEQFNQSVELNPNEVITEGLIFDPQVFIEIREYYETNFVMFGRASTVFLSVGYGSLLRLVSTDDALAILCGINRVIKYSILPTGPLKFNNGSSYHSPSSGLGSSCYIDDSSFISGRAGGDLWMLDSFQTYVRHKHQKCDAYAKSEELKCETDWGSFKKTITF